MYGGGTTEKTRWTVEHISKTTAAATIMKLDATIAFAIVLIDLQNRSGIG